MRLRLLCVLAALAAVPVLPLAQVQEPPAQPAPVFRGGVELMNLSVTVTDKRGRNVTDLTRDDFMVAEDGKVQQIVDFRSVKESVETPIGLGFVIDASRSMEGDRLDSMRTAVQDMLGRMRKDDAFFVMEVATTTKLGQDWTTDRRKTVDAIRRIRTRTQTGSFLRNGVLAALDVFKTSRHKKQVLVIVTDGDPQGGDMSTVSSEAVALAARASDVIVYALVLDAEEAGAGNRGVGNNTVRQTALEWARITDASGGRTQYTQGYQQIEEAIDQLGKEFTQQYEISYQRPPADNRQHQIVVGVKRQDVQIRHRRVYLAR